MKRFTQKHITIHKGYLRYKRKYCHRLIWEQDIGPIPEGYDIHHKDGNKLNNLLENLECLSKADHMRLHANETREKRSKCMSDNSEKVHAWLKTPKGKKFLSKKAKKQFADRLFKTFICEICQKQFKTKSNKQVMYCSGNCVTKARRLSGVDNITRQCVICCKPFVINKYQKTVTCTYECRNRLIAIKKTKVK